MHKKMYNEFKKLLSEDQEFIRKMSQNLSNTSCVWGDESKVYIGKNVELVNTLLNTSSGEIHIGDYTFTGHNVSIITGSHDVQEYGLQRQIAVGQNRDILIGKGVWICSNAVVLGPCEIENNSVVAAGAVVLPGTKINENEIYAGVPARKVNTIQTSGKKHILAYGFHLRELMGDNQMGAWTSDTISIIYAKKENQKYSIKIDSPIDDNLIKINYDGIEMLYNLCKGLNTIEIEANNDKNNHKKIIIENDYIWSPAQIGINADARVLGLFVYE